jgi:hypothetical protein
MLCYFILSPLFLYPPRHGWWEVLQETFPEFSFDSFKIQKGREDEESSVPRVCPFQNRTSEFESITFLSRCATQKVFQRFKNNTHQDFRRREASNTTELFSHFRDSIASNTLPKDTKSISTIIIKHEQVIQRRASPR